MPATVGEKFTVTVQVAEAAIAEQFPSLIWKKLDAPTPDNDSVTARG